MVQHLVRVADLNRPTIEELLDRAEALRLTRTSVSTRGSAVLGLAFFETSTRTLAGFQSAISRLGGVPIVLTSPRFRADMSEPESFEDTVRVVSAYCDALVIRHGSVDAPKRAVGVSSCPVINGGNGDDEHPTQALIDLFAIRRWCRRLEQLRVAVIGDLKGSRSAHSLIAALLLFEPREVRLIHPPGRGLPPELRGQSGAFTERGPTLDLAGIDVVYMAGLPAGTGAGAVSADMRAVLRLTAEHAAGLPVTAVVLSPLPRIDEIDPSLDGRANFRYFQQSADGLFVRMAVLEWVLPTTD